MNTIVFHPWASRAGNTDNPDQLRIDLDPQPGTGFRGCGRRSPWRCARCSPRSASPHSSRPAGTAGCTSSPRSSRRTSSWMCATPSSRAARELERRMPDKVTTAGGRRNAASGSSSTSTRPIATARWPAPTARARCRTPPCRCPLEWDELRGCRPASLHHPHGAGAAGRPRATRGRRCTSIRARIDTLLEWWERDLDGGLGELPFPPDFPKMPGEPPRVQPSRARKDA